MSKRTRRYISPEQKAAILKRHILEKEPISEICEKEKIQPSLFYQWQRQLVENATAAMEGPKRSSGQERALQERIEQLEAKLAKKDSVIAEISAEYVTLKKELGEP